VTVSETLESMPALPWLYARALRQAARSRLRPPSAGETASSWRTEAVRVDGVPVVEDRLTAYRRVCGFAAGDAVPATYPQMLAFPLQLLVLTGAGFPFPALGAVHVANTVEQHEPIPLGAVLDLAVHATDLRPHRRGRQVTVVTEAHVAGRVVWRAESDYLRVERSAPRSGGADDVPTPHAAAADAAARRGPESWELSSDLGRRYAGVSGDRNPIHLYDVTARPFGFRRHIAHGMWTLARCLAELEGDLPARMRCEASFRRPVTLPGRVEFTASAVEGGFEFSVGSTADPDRHLRGRVEPR
jgi:acyl dehydratase